MRVSVYIEDCTVDQAGALVEAVRDLKKLTQGASAVAAIAAGQVASNEKAAKAAAPKALTPAVKALAEELGVADATIPGTGKDGNVTQGDVKAYAKRKATADDASTPGPVVPESEETGDTSLNDVKGALKDLNEVKGMPACLKVLAMFQAANVSAVPVDKYADFVIACNLEAA